MLCLGRWDDLGAGGRATRVAGCLLTSRVACWVPEWPVGYQSGLLATRVACWLPELVCWLPEWPVSNQSGLLATRVGVSWIRWSRTRIWTWSCGALGTTAYHGHDDGVGFRHDE